VNAPVGDIACQELVELVTPYLEGVVAGIDCDGLHARGDLLVDGVVLCTA
jgi:hypothetical protein